MNKEAAEFEMGLRRLLARMILSFSSRSVLDGDTESWQTMKGLMSGSRRFSAIFAIGSRTVRHGIRPFKLL